ncbi:hypothetical protein [Bacillus subtilis]|uniref:hypothetical protein n=1 Tax=Bacillus subtilis TaxID=1423 RepID=UPI0023EB537E|nr:hypothetical protein [Bacillus subtilis]MDF4219350.1 hypothetical protein [Bacillus subtilis]
MRQQIEANVSAVAVFARDNTELVPLNDRLDLRKVITQYGRHLGAINREYIPL